MLLRWDEPLRPLSRVSSGRRFFCLRVSEDLIPFGAWTPARVPDLSRLPLQNQLHKLRCACITSQGISRTRLELICPPRDCQSKSLRTGTRSPCIYPCTDAVARIRAVHAAVRTETKRRSCSISAHAPPLIPPRLISSSLPHRRFRTGFQGLSASLACRERLPSLHAPRRNPQRCSVTARTGTINAFPHTRSLHLGNSDRPRPTGTLKTDSQERGRRAGSRRRSNLP